MTDFAVRLLDWFDQQGRKDLPWQQDITPYRVWVSEIMLQQTQVTTVIPYYERFIARFPSIDTLAAATEDEVLHEWTGLGYYARARNLHATAREIIDKFNGDFPDTLEILESLRGIGRSTAGAIVAICTGQRATILDGNVKRVLSRYFAIDGWPGSNVTGRALWEKAKQLTPIERVSDYTQAIMDLGAMICTRTSPDCTACPFSEDCIALATQSINRYPGRKPGKALPVRTTTMLVVQNPEGAVLLQKRPRNGLWGGLWSFPECESNVLEQFLAQHHLLLEQQSSLPGFRHTFTHFHLDIELIQLAVRDAAARIAELNGSCWYDQNKPARIGLTRPVSRILGALVESH